MFLNDAKQELQKMFDLEWRTVQKTTFCLNVWNLFRLKISLSLFLSQ